MDLNFFPEKGRQSSVEEKYTQPALRVPEVSGSRATFEFNQALVDELGLTTDNHIAFAIADDRLFAKVVPELPEGTKPRFLNLNKTPKTTSLGRVRTASSKPVATWMQNSLSWIDGEQDLFFTQYEENVYELVSAVEAERYEAQAYDAAEEIINEQNVFA